MTDHQINWIGSRTLRLAPLFSFLLAIGLTIPPSVVHNTPLPAVSLVPLAASTIFSSSLLTKRGRRLSPLLITFADLLLALSLMAVFVLTWVVWSHKYYWHTNVIMLAALSTISPLTSFCIHAVLVLRTIYLGLAEGSRAECPHCSRNIYPRVPVIPWFRRTSDELARLLSSDNDGDDDACMYRDDEHPAETGKQAGIQGQTSQAPGISETSRVMLS